MFLKFIGPTGLLSYVIRIGVDSGRPKTTDVMGDRITIQPFNRNEETMTATIPRSRLRVVKIKYISEGNSLATTKAPIFQWCPSVPTQLI